MPDIDLTSIAPVTDAEAARLASPAALADLATRIAATEAPVTRPDAVRPDGARPRRFRPPLSRPHPGNRRPRRRLALLTSFPVALAAVAALLVTVLSPGGGEADSGANSQAAIQAMSFTKENGTITVIINNPYADAAWYNADLARHHIPVTLAVIPSSPSLVGTIIGGDYIPGLKQLAGRRSCFYESTGSTGPCLMGFTVPVNLKDRDGGSVWIGGPARPGQKYNSIGSIFAPREALTGLLKQVAGQPMSKVRPILASHHLTIAEASSSPVNGPYWKDVNPARIPGGDYVTRIEPFAAGQVRIYVSPQRFWWGSEPVKLPNSAPPAKKPPNDGFTRVTPGPSTPAPPVKPTPTTSS
jgi:hypothetical protein